MIHFFCAHGRWIWMPLGDSLGHNNTLLIATISPSHTAAIPQIELPHRSAPRHSHLTCGEHASRNFAHCVREYRTPAPRALSLNPRPRVTKAKLAFAR